MAYASVEKIILPVFARVVGRVVGAEHLPLKPPYLLAANHIDFLDGFYIAAAVDRNRKHTVYFITKTNNYWWSQTTISISKSKGRTSLDTAFRYLKSGKIICNFIEGQRNSTRTLSPARSGTARLALLTGVPVIPVGIRGPVGKNFVRSLTNLVTERKSVEVRFGPPVDLTDLADRADQSAAVAEASHRIMAALVPLTGKAYVR
ncbi:MAG: 1-acyl-sn-glycerol-3-phosphate acyltransferase [Candidatus Kerfeldbacteria bacterium]|nr:1-acyl-sn-glycerol-3-phosphate acyltransferase [Candidatus Kerfeldbacteria bacterium]